MDKEGFVRVKRSQEHGKAALAILVAALMAVLLGAGTDLETKLSVMCDTLPELYGRKGTLYLDTYKQGELHPSYIFK